VVAYLLVLLVVTKLSGMHGTENWVVKQVITLLLWFCTVMQLNVFIFYFIFIYFFGAAEIIMCYILPGKKFMRDEDSN